ncbi:SRPBCC family protein [Streptomyces sp. NPDC013455]|uniref:SRPBCC family protein n=1 Tax=Streptomyces sp. NPDC013455 TaxID=3155605 RepID=UPI0033F1F4DC
MRHQVFVPVPAERLGAALADPARVARAVPGLHQDAGAEPVAGRLKLRVGGHSVTYRGTARVTAREDGSYAVEGDATEARGTGAVTFALTLRLADGDGGCAVTAEGTAEASGRITELPADAVTSAATRLLNRFLENLATDGDDTQEPADEAEGPADEAEEGGAGTQEGEAAPPESAPQESAAQESAPQESAAREAEAREPGAPGADSGRASVFGTGAPPSAPGPGGDDGVELDVGTGAADRPAGDFADTGEPPAEAAHARRTMIGRSAEEVDHAPPRGRYAPVPAPQTIAGNPALRWAAPAAALAVASAIVVTRALRRRR